jgi:hypothetical protein
MHEFELPAEQPRTPEVTPGEKKPEQTVIDGTLGKIKGEEREEAERQKKIDQIKRAPIVH